MDIMWLKVYNKVDDDYAYINVNHIVWFYDRPCFIRTIDGEKWQTDKATIDSLKKFFNMEI